jgi:hypothetical protein
LAEIIACEWLIRQGYELFRNISQHGIADYVACKAGEAPIVIDVKTHVRGFVNPTAAQRAGGVQILYVDRATRLVSFNRQDFAQPISQRLGRRPAAIPRTEAASPPRGLSSAAAAESPDVD